MRQNIYARHGRGTVKLYLSQDRYTIIDRAELPRVLPHPWHAERMPHSDHYAASTRINGVHRTLHSFLLGAERGRHVVHLNGDLLDNRRANLALAGQVPESSWLTSTRRTPTRIPGVRKATVVSGGEQRPCWRFRCRRRACPLTRHFPYTEQGYAQAQAVRIIHLAALAAAGAVALDAAAVDHLRAQVDVEPGHRMPHTEATRA